MAKVSREKYYVVEHLFRDRKGNYSYRQIAMAFDKASALRRAKNETGRNVVKEVKSIAFFADGEKQW